MRSCLRHFSFCVFATLLCAGFSLGANLEDAKRAYHQRDYPTAVKEFTDLAEQGDWEAQFFVGSLYLLPQKDVGEGLKWLRLSADQGEQDAQLLLGKAYMKGDKVLPRDPIQGEMWLRLAAKDNKEFYQDALHEAARQITA